MHNERNKTEQEHLSPKKIQENVFLLNWEAHAKIQVLLKEKKFFLKKSLTSLLHQAFQWMAWFKIEKQVQGIFEDTYILLIKREGRTGRISARGLDSMDQAQRGPYKKDQGPIFSQYGP